MTKISEIEYEELMRQELISYDKKRHLTLLNEQDKKFHTELRTYEVILFFQLIWEVKDQYLEMLNDYIEEKIDIWSFESRFSKRTKSLCDLTDILLSNRVLLSPDKNSVNFGLLVDKIADYCLEPSEMEKFESEIKKVYSEIQDLLSDA
jgi:hypothetical protein